MVIDCGVKLRSLLVPRCKIHHGNFELKICTQKKCSSPPARWGLLDFIRAVLLILLLLVLLLLPPPPRPPPFLPPLPPLPCPLLPCQLLAKLFANFGVQCALLDLNLGPSQLSAHPCISTWDLPSSVRTAGPQPGTCGAQCAPLDINLGPSELSAHRWTSKAR